MSNITEKVKQIVEYEKDIAAGIEEIKQFLIHPDTQQAELPPKHSFSPGIYVRELAIPEGTLLIGKIHKHRHHNFLMKGTIIVLTEANGIELLQAPLMIVSEPGTQRVGYALTDSIWTTAHVNEDDGQDIKVIEDRIVVEEKSQYLEYKKKLTKKLST